MGIARSKLKKPFSFPKKQHSVNLKSILDTHIRGSTQDMPVTHMAKRNLDFAELKFKQ